MTTIGNQSLAPNDPKQSYVCEGSGRLNDPYEGELFTFWLQFFGGLSQNDIQAIWAAKRPQLVSVDYNMGGVGPITVQKGEFLNIYIGVDRTDDTRLLVLQPRDLEGHGDALLRHQDH